MERISSRTVPREVQVGMLGGFCGLMVASLLGKTRFGGYLALKPRNVALLAACPLVSGGVAMANDKWGNRDLQFIAPLMVGMAVFCVWLVRIEGYERPPGCKAIYSRDFYTGLQVYRYVDPVTGLTVPPRSIPGLGKFALHAANLLVAGVALAGSLALAAQEAS